MDSHKLIQVKCVTVYLIFYSYSQKTLMVNLAFRLAVVVKDWRNIRVCLLISTTYNVKRGQVSEILDEKDDKKLLTILVITFIY